MHGFIFAEVKKYVESKLDRDTWYAILDKASLPGKEFENYLDHPDEQIVSIVVTASEMTGTPVPNLLEDFGVFLGHDLIRIYKPLLDPEWKTLDFLANVEDTVHEVVRGRNSQAKPPALVCNRIGPNEVMIVYNSPRKMGALALGIVRGVANHYEEDVSITTDNLNMEDEGRSCTIHVALNRPGLSSPSPSSPTSFV